MIHRISNGNTCCDKEFHTVSDNKMKSRLIDDYLRHAIEDYNYKNEGHLTLHSVDYVFSQTKPLWKKYGFYT
ncbi:hypothetical protein AAHA92_14942 [Salvia divinorum]|uniref:Uncharacterized protein n=1 Tax=Salvia divinorum TaxID=28513 RepID=A0ABD1HD74_SALDI